MPATIVTQKSPSAVRSELKRLGFWHATGLPWIDAIHDEEGQIQAHHQHIGHWGCDGKWTVAVLTNGEVWLAKNGEPNEECKKFLRKACPNGRGADIPFVDRRLIDPDHVAERVFDPYSFCDGYADPDPKPI